MRVLIYIVAAIFLSFATGCTLLVDISAPCPKSSSLTRISRSDAVQIFQQVANKVGFLVLEPTDYGKMTNYHAVPTPGSAMNDAHLDAYISEDQMIFYCVADNHSHARELAVSVELALSKQGISYCVSERTASWLNN